MASCWIQRGTFRCPDCSYELVSRSDSPNEVRIQFCSEDCYRQFSAKFHSEEKPHVDQLAQIAKGPVHDGNLISKTHRDELAQRGLVFRSAGFNALTAEGINTCVALGLLKS